MNSNFQYGIPGIDISHWDGPVHLQLVKDAGIQFVYIKATEGITGVDPMFTENVKRAHQAQLYYGAYHFINWEDDISDQMHHFAQIADPQERGTLPLCLDAEGVLPDDDEDRKLYTSIVERAIVDLQQYQFQKPMIYCNIEWFNAVIKHLDPETFYLWIASWEHPLTDYPEIRAQAVMRQFSEEATVSEHIAAQFDGNVFYAGEKIFAAVLGYPPEADPTATELETSAKAPPIETNQSSAIGAPAIR
jgi:lysozyme